MRANDCGELHFLTIRIDVAHSKIIKTEVAHFKKEVRHPASFNYVGDDILSVIRAIYH